MFVKFSNCTVLEASFPTVGRVAAQGKRLGSFEYQDRGEGFLYVSVRACTADVPNLNCDMLPHWELKTAYRTFVGKPVYVNHANTNLDRARGFIIDAIYHDEDPSDRWIEILMEMDEVTFPTLCRLIRAGEIDTVSMGLNCETTTCSVCGNVAEYPAQFCEHIQQKGREFGGVLAYEVCNGISFFEESWVYDPADPTATVQALEDESRVAKTAGKARDFGPDNFYVETDANFSEIGERPLGEPDYTSESGSEYWYLPDGVVRGADHWGYGIGGCNWYLDGQSRQTYGIELYGFSPWSGFESTRNYDFCFDSQLEKVTEGYVESGMAGTLEDYMFGEMRWRHTDMNDDIYDEAKEVLQVTASAALRTAASGEWVDGTYGDGSMQFEVYDDEDTLFSGAVMPEGEGWVAWMTSPENLMTYGDEAFETEDEAMAYVEEQARSEGFEIVADNMVNKLRIPEEVDMQNSDRVCPICGSPDFDGTYCDVCDYVEYAEGFGDIDTEEARGEKEQRDDADETPDEEMTDDIEDAYEENDGERSARRRFDISACRDDTLCALAAFGYADGIDFDIADGGSTVVSSSVSLNNWMDMNGIGEESKWL